jgi:cytochrome c2
MRLLGLVVLIALAPAAAFAQSAGGDPARGSDVFQDRCTACHVLGHSAQGPDLNGVVGRRAASLPGFNYSAAMKASNLTWTRDVLDKFLSGPTKLVPGTNMRAMVADPEERRDLVAYLASLKGGGH